MGSCTSSTTPDRFRFKYRHATFTLDPNSPHILVEYETGVTRRWHGSWTLINRKNRQRTWSSMTVSQRRCVLEDLHAGTLIFTGTQSYGPHLNGLILQESLQ